MLACANALMLACANVLMLASANALTMTMHQCSFMKIPVIHVHNVSFLTSWDRLQLIANLTLPYLMTVVLVTVAVVAVAVAVGAHA
eukprot:scaffold26477_cov22-Tisochrysis_lutea.AAC.3